MDLRDERKHQQKEKDKTQQTFFQTDSEDSEILKPGNSLYQLRIDLDGIRPPVWRRILIPGTGTMRDLHQAIQDVMGWEDYHLHQFMVDDPFSGQPITMENHDEETEKIEDWFTMENPNGIYIYDFGDNWEHIIELEVITHRDKKATYPQCIKGKRACPPEDCGGVGGYLEMLDTLKDPKHEEYEETVEWLGEDFNPEHFNPEDVIFKDTHE
ncbi:MAG: plasmid pRiA4b ORF-3 family protein [Euryarchaeota archaeon]|nr:plasmid pRiA4b ORF-3 family protein [Euryarchaeota archaeon]